MLGMIHKLVINMRIIFKTIHFVLLACLINIEVIHASILPEIFEGDARTPLFLLTILTAIPYILSNKLIKIEINYIIVLIVVFIIYIFINYELLSLAEVYGGRKYQGIVMGVFIGFFLPLLTQYSYKDIKYFFLVLLISDLVISIIMIVINGIPNSSDMGRLSFGELNTIWLSRFYGEIIILLLLIVRNNYLKVSLSIIFTIGMIFTGSKGPIMSMFIVLMALFFLQNKYKLTVKQLYRVPLLVLSGIGIIYIIFNKVILKFTNIDFLLYRFSVVASESSYTEGGRMSLINLALKLFTEKPVFGYGLGSYGYYKTGSDLRAYPHNLFMEVLAELGLTGFVLLSIIITLFVLNLYKLIIKNKFKSKTLNIVLLLVVFYLINSMVSGDLGTSNYYIYIYAGFLNYFFIKNNTVGLKQGAIYR